MVTKLLIPALALLGGALSSCDADQTPAQYLERARVFENEGNYRAAAIETRNALKSDGDNHSARLSLGLLQLRLGNVAGAEKELLKARELGADKSETNPALARVLLQQGRYEELKALVVNGLNPEAQASMLASQAYADLADDDQIAAGSKAEQALSLDPELVEAKLMQARLAAVSGDLTGAEKQLDSALGTTPENADLWELLGDVQREKGHPKQAIVSYGQTIKLANRSAGARLKRAQVNLQLENETEALKDLNALSKAGVEAPGIKVAKGQIELRNGRFDEAQLSFEEALKEAPEFPAALSSLALTHLALGNPGQAEQYGKQLMSVTGDSENARRVLASIRLETDRYALVEETVRPILLIGGRIDPISFRLLNTALLKSGKLDEAIEQMGALTSVLLPEEPNQGEQGSTESPMVLTNKPSHFLLEEVLGIKQPGVVETAEPFLDMTSVRIARVMELIARGNFSEAMKESEQVHAAMPDSAVPYNLIGRVHLASERVNEARVAFNTALKTDADNHSSQRWLAELDLRAGDVDAAREGFEKLTQGNQTTESALLSMARVEAEANDEAKMLQWLERAQTEHPDSPDSTLLLARHFATKGDNERALEELARLDDRQRQQDYILELEGTLLMLLSRFDEAVERFDILVRLQPESAQSLYLRARAHAGMKNSEAALRDLNAAVERSPDHSPSLLALTNFDLLRNDIPSAETRVALLRDLIPGRPELNVVVNRLENKKEAGSSERVPNRLQIESTEAALTAARELFTNGEIDKATGLLEAWLEANPQDVRARLTLANTYGSTDRPNEAVVQYETVLEGDGEALPEQSRLAALNNLAWYLRDIDPDLAVDYATQALDVSPDSVQTLDTLAMIHFGQGNSIAAKKAFDTADEIGIDDPIIRYHGAQIEAALGNDDAARALLEPLVHDSVEFAEAQEASDLLETLR